MTSITAQQPGPAVRASDAERDRAVALLQRHFADGRLTRGELEDRAAAAYTARTTDQLDALTADLPPLHHPAEDGPAQPRVALDPCLLCLLLCVCPPAGLAYWLLSLRKEPAAAAPAVMDQTPAAPHRTPR